MIRTRINHFASFAFFLMLVLGSSFDTLEAAEAHTYVFATLNVPDALETTAEGINDNGQIVGAYTDAILGAFHGFVYDDGVFTTIDFPGGSETVAFGINNRGHIVGAYASNEQHGFMLKEDSFTSIDVPFSTGVFQTRANGINHRGQIVGEYLDNPDSNQQHGFLYDNGVFTSIDVPDAFVTSATAINNRREIVGFYEDGTGLHAFLYHDGVFTSIDVPFPGGFGTVATGINNRGQIGSTRTASGCTDFSTTAGCSPRSMRPARLTRSSSASIGVVRSWVSTQIAPLRTVSSQPQKKGLDKFTGLL